MVSQSLTILLSETLIKICYSRLVAFKNLKYLGSLDLLLHGQFA